MDNRDPIANRRDENQHHPENDNENENERPDADQVKNQSPMKGTDTQATTDAAIAEREKGKRTTM